MFVCVFVALGIQYVPCCHPWPVRLYSIFLHYLKKRHDFRKKLLNTKCVFWISLQLLSEMFLIIRRNERDLIKNVIWSSCKKVKQFHYRLGQEVETHRFQDNRHMKVVRMSTLCTGHLYPPRNIPDTHFCFALNKPYGHSAVGRIMSMKNFNATIRNRTRDLPACSAVPQLTAQPQVKLSVSTPWRHIEGVEV
jgi:hypothetical protein